MLVANTKITASRNLYGNENGPSQKTNRRAVIMSAEGQNTGSASQMFWLRKYPRLILSTFHQQLGAIWVTAITPLDAPRWNWLPHSPIRLPKPTPPTHVRIPRRLRRSHVLSSVINTATFRSDGKGIGSLYFAELCFLPLHPDQTIDLCKK